MRCWDALDVHETGIISLNDRSSIVFNFPIEAEESDIARQLSQICSLRNVELATVNDSIVPPLSDKGTRKVDRSRE